MLLSLLLAGSFSAATAAPPLMLHLRADTGIELSTSGHVAKWKDLSPRQAVYEAAKGDTTYRPTLLTDGIGGHPSVRFSGSQALQDSSSLPLDSGCTILIVAQDSSGKGVETGLLDKGYADLALALWGGAAGNITFSYSYQATLARSSLDTSAPTLFESSWGDSVAKLYANGLLLDSEHQPYSLNSSSRNKVTTIGGTIDAYGYLGHFLKGRIAEIRVYAGVLTDSLRKSIEDSLLARYQLPPQLPHPILHLRADTGIELSASGHVSKWKDLSARHTDFVPASGDTLRSPSLNPHGIGNKASVHFSGSQALQDSSWLPLDSGCTILIVAQDSSGKGAETGLLDKGPDDLALSLWGNGAGNVSFSYSWEETIARSKYDTTASTLYEATWNGALAKIFANGTLLDSAIFTSSINSFTPARNKVTTLAGVIDNSGNLNHFMKGEIAEVRVYPGVLSDSLRKVVEDSLIARYIDTTKSPSAIAMHSRLANLPRLSQLHEGNLLIEGATPLGLYGIDGRAIRFASIQAQEGMLLKPSKSLVPGQYLLSTDHGTIRFVIVRP